MSSVFSRGHRICRSTKLRLPEVNVASRRHLQLEVVPTSSESSSLPTSFEEPLPPTENKRFKRFNELYEFTQGGLGVSAKRSVPSRGIRSTSWNKLFMWAETAEQLETVAEMFPRWREMQRSFRAKDSELFVRRCEELNCPLLALRVFSNHPKYGFPLSSHSAALQLLHSLHLAHPLQETITASALFKLNNLPPISSSLPACAMIVSACLYSQWHPTLPKDPRAGNLADVFLPALQILCADTPAYIGREPGGMTTRGRFDLKPNIWAVGALKTIQKILCEEGKTEYKWVGRALKKFGRGVGETGVLALGVPGMLALAAPALESTEAGETAVDGTP